MSIIWTLYQNGLYTQRPERYHLQCFNVFNFSKSVSHYFVRVLRINKNGFALKDWTAIVVGGKLKPACALDFVNTYFGIGLLLENISTSQLALNVCMLLMSFLNTQSFCLFEESARLLSVHLLTGYICVDNHSKMNINLLVIKFF